MSVNKSYNIKKINKFKKPCNKMLSSCINIVKGEIGKIIFTVHGKDGKYEKV